MEVIQNWFQFLIQLITNELVGFTAKFRYRRRFNLFDANKDGIISVSEMQDFCDRMGFTVSPYELVVSAQVDKKDSLQPKSYVCQTL